MSITFNILVNFYPFYTKIYALFRKVLRIEKRPKEWYIKVTERMIPDVQMKK